MYKYRIVGVVLLLLTVSIFPITTQQPTPTKTAKFVLAGWDYPDEYGQGIYRVTIEQYSNGGWVAVVVGGVQGWAGDPIEYNITNGEGSNGTLRINVHSYLNGTLCGISDVNDGPALIRHNITVSTPSNSSVFDIPITEL